MLLLWCMRHVQVFQCFEVACVHIVYGFVSSLHIFEAQISILKSFFACIHDHYIGKPTSNLLHHLKQLHRRRKAVEPRKGKDRRKLEARDHGPKSKTLFADLNQLARLALVDRFGRANFVLKWFCSKVCNVMQSTPNRPSSTPSMLWHKS